MQRVLTVKESQAMFAAIDEAKANKDWRDFMRGETTQMRPLLTKKAGDRIKLVDIQALGAPEVWGDIYERRDHDRLYVVHCDCDFGHPEDVGVLVDENGRMVGSRERKAS